MALIIEDGSVVALADSYVTKVEFYDYAHKRGLVYSTSTEEEIEQNLRKAFDYLIQKYRHQWSGFRKSADQVADWPREFVYLEPFILGGTSTNPFLVSNTIVPTEVKSAQIELAIKAQTDDLMADLDQQEKEVQIGSLRVVNDTNSPQAKRYSKVDAMLRPYLKNVNSLTVTAQRA